MNDDENEGEGCLLQGCMLHSSCFMLHDDDGDDDNDQADIYIMVKCLSVCVSVSKSHYFCIQRIWSFLLFTDTFRIQRISSFLQFIDTTFQKVSRNSKTKKLLEIMTFQGVW